MLFVSVAGFLVWYYNMFVYLLLGHQRGINLVVNHLCIAHICVPLTL